MQSGLQFKQFDMTSIRDDSVVMIFGKPKTGKSWLTKNILYHKHKDTGTGISYGTVIAGPKDADTYSGIVPPTQVHETYSTEVMSTVITRQSTLMQKSRKSNDRNAFLILDDCLPDNPWNGLDLRECFLNGRNFRLMLIIALDLGAGIEPVFRVNTDYIFILRENILSERKLLYKMCTDLFPCIPTFSTFEEFCETMDQCGEFECLVIDNTSKHSIREDIYWYKADTTPPFTIGE